MFHDRLVIDNPGGLVGDLKVEDLYNKSFPRNKLLFGLMQRMNLVEKIGSGLARINEMMEEFLLPHPIIYVSNSIFSITFERPDLQKMTIEERRKIYQDKLGDKLGEKLGENQIKILALIGNNPKITIIEIANNINISTTAVENNIKKLKEKKIIRRIGSDKGGYWEVLK
ncbi:MAG: ATP-binding protein [Candidatus Kuenenbacteria bacterium]